MGMGEIGKRDVLGCEYPSLELASLRNKVDDLRRDVSSINSKLSYLAGQDKEPKPVVSGDPFDGWKTYCASWPGMVKSVGGVNAYIHIHGNFKAEVSRSYSENENVLKISCSFDSLKDAIMFCDGYLNGGN